MNKKVLLRPLFMLLIGFFTLFRIVDSDLAWTIIGVTLGLIFIIVLIVDNYIKKDKKDLNTKE